MKTVLLPTDGSEIARNAIDFAIQMHKGTPCRYLIIHTYPSALHHPDLVGMQMSHEGAEAEEALKKEVGLIEQKYKELNLEVEPLCVFGFMTDVLLRVTEEQQVDMIVMGTHGSKSAWEEMIGSNTWDVIKHVTCPLLVIPPDTKYTSLKQLLLAIDEHEIENNQLIYPLSELAIRFNSTLTLLYVYKNEKEQKKITIERARHWNTLFMNIQHHITTVHSDDVESAIIRYIEQAHPDLLAVITHQRGMIGSLLHKSMTKRLAMHTSIPLLILQNTER